MPQRLITYLGFIKAPGSSSENAQTFDPLFWIVFGIVSILIISACVFVYSKKKNFKKIVFGAGVFALSLVCVFGGVKAFASYNAVVIDNEINAEINNDAQTVNVLPGNMQKNCDFDVSLNSFTANYCDGVTGMDGAT